MDYTLEGLKYESGRISLILGGVPPMEEDVREDADSLTDLMYDDEAEWVLPS